MEYTQLGRTGLTVSRLCLGTMNFGPQTTEEDAMAIMDKTLELGINFFDTANAYGRNIKIKFSKADLEKLDEIWPVPAVKRLRRTRGDLRIYILPVVEWPILPQFHRDASYRAYRNHQ